jgi:hypothetical protein
MFGQVWRCNDYCGFGDDAGAADDSSTSTDAAAE